MQPIDTKAGPIQIWMTEEDRARFNRLCETTAFARYDRLGIPAGNVFGLYVGNGLRDLDGLIKRRHAGQAAKPAVNGRSR